MAKRRNSPALFELLRDRDTAAAVAVPTDPGAQDSSAGLGTSLVPTPMPVETAEVKPAPPAREPAPLKAEPEMEISTPRFVALPSETPADEPPMPEVADLEPEPVVSRTDDGTIRFALSPANAAMAAAGVVILLVVVWIVAFSLGQQDSVQERVPILAEDAGRVLEGSGRTAAAEPSLREPGDADRQTRRGDGTELASGGGLNSALPITPEPETIRPVVPQGTTGDETPAVEAVEQPVQDPNIDTREPGLNYMHLGQVYDQAEAIRTLEFLRSNGIRAIALEGTSGDRTSYMLLTLHGFGKGDFSSREKIDHERTIFSLGETWLSEHRGKLDFSRKSQTLWKKYNP